VPGPGGARARAGKSRYLKLQVQSVPHFLRVNRIRHLCEQVCGANQATHVLIFCARELQRREAALIASAVDHGLCAVAPQREPKIAQQLLCMTNASRHMLFDELRTAVNLRFVCAPQIACVVKQRADQRH